MIYVFTDSRVIYDGSLLRDADKGKYLAVESLPIAADNGMVPIYCADMKKKQVIIQYAESASYTDEEETELVEMIEEEE